MGGREAVAAVGGGDFFVSPGGGVGYPAAGFSRFAKENNARSIEINPETKERSLLSDEVIGDEAGKARPELFEWPGDPFCKKPRCVGILYSQEISF
jgi:hypothetical protein